MNVTRAASLVLLVLVVSCASEHQPTAEDRAREFREALAEGDRFGETNDAAGAVAAYSRAIDLAPHSALAWFKRGTANAAAGDPAGATADFSKAIEFNLAGALAWFHRAKAEQAQGNAGAAIADYSKALSIRTTGEFLRGRGHARFCYGDLDSAVNDLEEAAHLQDAGPQLDFTQLELAAARLRTRRRAEAVDGLKRHFRLTRPTPDSAWPRQIAAFLTGDLPESDFLLTAKSAEESTRRERSCEAFFYAGITRLAAGDEPGAITFFRECLDNAIPGFVEPDMARAELKRLGAER